jgi:hypothetical protein
VRSFTAPPSTGSSASRSTEATRQAVASCASSAASTARSKAARIVVARALRDAPQQLVGRDLEVLERECEAGELGGGVGLGAEEAPDVHAAEAQQRALEARRARVVSRQPGLDCRLLRARLGEVVLEGLAQLRVARERRGRLEQGQRL